MTIDIVGHCQYPILVSLCKEKTHCIFIYCVLTIDWFIKDAGEQEDYIPSL